MTNPISIFESLRQTYLRYLDSPFDLRYPDLVNERRQLLDTDGRLYRNPLIEPVPAYELCGQTFDQVAQSLLGATWASADVADLVQFVSQGLFPAKRQLFTHQREVFEAVTVQGRDAIITTGTGSGKTEAFLLPIAAALVRESAAWGAPNPRSQQWDWWNQLTIQPSGRRRLASRIAQRQHENVVVRPPAMRALILYPLNALVEDQLARLRDSFDSPQARAWYRANRLDNRLYFGRYTGRTPGSGARNANATSRLRRDLRELHQESLLVVSV